MHAELIRRRSWCLAIPFLGNQRESRCAGAARTAQPIKEQRYLAPWRSLTTEWFSDTAFGLSTAELPFMLYHAAFRARRKNFLG